MKLSYTLKALDIKAKCPYCDEWTPWGGDDSGSLIECESCGKLFEISDIENITISK